MNTDHLKGSNGLFTLTLKMCLNLNPFILTSTTLPRVSSFWMKLFTQSLRFYDTQHFPVRTCNCRLEQTPVWCSFFHVAAVKAVLSYNTFLMKWTVCSNIWKNRIRSAARY